MADWLLANLTIFLLFDYRGDTEQGEFIDQKEHNEVDLLKTGAFYFCFSYCKSFSNGTIYGTLLATLDLLTLFFLRHEDLGLKSAMLPEVESFVTFFVLLVFIVVFLYY